MVGRLMTPAKPRWPIAHADHIRCDRIANCTKHNTSYSLIFNFLRVFYPDVENLRSYSYVLTVWAYLFPFYTLQVESLPLHVTYR